MDAEGSAPATRSVNALRERWHSSQHEVILYPARIGMDGRLWTWLTREAGMLLSEAQAINEYVREFFAAGHKSTNKSYTSDPKFLTRGRMGWHRFAPYADKHNA
jgi:hypothetical protein